MRFRREELNRIYLILGTITLILFLSMVQSTYAKYVTSASGSADIGIARWRILINNNDIAENRELSNVITPTFNGNSNIASGVIAPTAEGYFDIIIDASNTDVSLRYEITTSENEDSAVSDLVISGYSIDDGARLTATNTDGQISIENNILYNDTDKDVKLRVFIEWNDDADNGAVMTNADDTLATNTANSEAKINVNVKFIQLPSDTVLEEEDPTT